MNNNNFFAISIFRFILFVLFCLTGQYTGKGKPLPEYHVKIAGFDERVGDCYSITYFPPPFTFPYLSALESRSA